MPGSAVKTLAKGVLKATARWFNPFCPGRRSKVRILTYHSVGDRDHEMNVSRLDFVEQMQWLSENATVISVGDAAQGKPGIAITFDDGYVDNLTNAAPILKEFGFPAIVYMVAGKAGGTLDQESDLECGQLMTWDEVRALESNGVSIGGHTLTHARLSTLTDDEQAREVQECTRILETELGHPVESFAYPYGSARDYNSESVSCVQNTGHQCAVSNRYGSVQPASSIWELPRIWIDGTDTIDTFALKASGGLDIMALQDSYPGIRLRRVVNYLPRVR
ncbi:MAG: polysaccharide deacetylase family protein [Candidatus Hydrogenedentota bacterium]